MLKAVSIAGKLLSPVENGAYPPALWLLKLKAEVPGIAASNEPVIGVESAGDITENQGEHKATNRTHIVFSIVDLVALGACSRQEQLALKGSSLVFKLQPDQSRLIYVVDDWSPVCSLFV